MPLPTILIPLGLSLITLWLLTDDSSDAEEEKRKQREQKRKQREQKRKQDQSDIIKEAEKRFAEMEKKQEGRWRRRNIREENGWAWEPLESRVRQYNQGETDLQRQIFDTFFVRAAKDHTDEEARCLEAEMDRLRSMRNRLRKTVDQALGGEKC